MEKNGELSSDEEVNFENPNFSKLKATRGAKSADSLTVEQAKSNDDLKAELNKVINDQAVKKLEDDLNLSKLNEQLKSLEQKIKNESNKLPKNWERYEDDKGAYFWHIPRYSVQLGCRTQVPH